MLQWDPSFTLRFSGTSWIRPEVLVMLLLVLVWRTEHKKLCSKQVWHIIFKTNVTAHQETSPDRGLLIDSLPFWHEDHCVKAAVGSATWSRGTLPLSRGVLLWIRISGEAEGCLPPLSEQKRTKSCTEAKAETNASSRIRCTSRCMVLCLYKGRS